MGKTMLYGDIRYQVVSGSEYRVSEQAFRYSFVCNLVIIILEMKLLFSAPTPRLRKVIYAIHITKQICSLISNVITTILANKMSVAI